MKGIYFSRKPKPRYLFTWDVTCVFKYLKTLVPLQQLPIKLLTLKVTALIALAVAPRAQTLVSMDLDCMVRENNALVFLFSACVEDFTCWTFIFTESGAL